MNTYPEMNEKIVGLLRGHDNPACQYAAQRIEELEKQLAEHRRIPRQPWEQVATDRLDRIWELEQEVAEANQRLASFADIQEREALLAENVIELRKQIAATRLKWQTGKPPKSGWYWVNGCWNTPDVTIRYLDPSLVDYDELFQVEEWAGPILPPEEE